MIFSGSTNRASGIRRAGHVAFLLAMAALLAACALPGAAPKGPTPDEIARQQRVERAQASLNEGIRLYEAGSYEDSLKNLLIALDSGVLTTPQQLNARKHLAFIQCINNRELICKEEFEKALALDASFELSPAEAGHPTWGPIFRLVKTEIELRKSGKALPPPIIKPPTPGEKIMAEAMKAYDDADYNKAIKLFQEAAREAMPQPDQIKAMKYAAFSYCLTNRMTLCRAEFEKILQIDATFELEAAEAGHPSWGPSFRMVKSKQKQAPAKK